MIDLNYKPKKKKEEDTPVGIIIMTMMPFAWLFWALVERGL